MDELADIVGLASARELARHFGGIRLYVPRRIGDNHPIAVAIGRDAADKLASSIGSQTIGIPRQPERRARVLDLRAQSLTIVQIARETTYSERHVYRLLREEDAERQPGLFDDQ